MAVGAKLRILNRYADFKICITDFKIFGGLICRIEKKAILGT